MAGTAPTRKRDLYGRDLISLVQNPGMLEEKRLKQLNFKFLASQYPHKGPFSEEEAAATKTTFRS